MSKRDLYKKLADEIELHVETYGDFESLGVFIHRHSDEIIGALRTLSDNPTKGMIDAVQDKLARTYDLFLGTDQCRLLINLALAAKEDIDA